MEHQMSEPIIDDIINSSEFKDLLKARKQLSSYIVGIIIPAYFGFVLLIAFSPNTLGTTFGDSPVSVGIYAGLALLVLSFLLTAVYLKISNGKITQLQNELRQKFYK
jgi:uncharacterized membrane protein (DUF485 family)